MLLGVPLPHDVAVAVGRRLAGDEEQPAAVSQDALAVAGTRVFQRIRLDHSACHRVFFRDGVCDCRHFRRMSARTGVRSDQIESEVQMKRLTAILAAAVLAASGCDRRRARTPEGQIVKALSQDRPYHAVPQDQFDQLGWDLPDGGATVKALADAAPGGAFDPRKLETAPAAKLGYRAKWHEVRYKVYGLDWDIPALQLTPNQPLPGVPTLAIINGGSANSYEFFIDPLNRPGLGSILRSESPSC